MTPHIISVARCQDAVADTEKLQKNRRPQSCEICSPSAARQLGDDFVQINEDGSKVHRTLCQQHRLTLESELAPDAKLREATIDDAAQDLLECQNCESDKEVSHCRLHHVNGRLSRIRLNLCSDCQKTLQSIIGFTSVKPSNAKDY